MLEFDESEYKQSVVSDKELILVTLFCGIETHDKLLYGGDELVRLTGATPPISIGRPVVGIVDGDHTGDSETEGQSA